LENKPCAFIIITLLVSILTTVNPPIVRASPNLTLTVETNKQLFYLRENINIYGNLTLDGSPIQDELVALEVYDPIKAIVFRTIQAGNPPPGKVSVIDLRSCADQWGTPKNRFQVGTTAWFNATVKNNDVVTRDVTISINAYDGNNIPLGVGRVTLPVVSGHTSWSISSVLIPGWARIGNATVYASAWIPDGAPYCPERSASFEIYRSSAPPGGLNPPIVQDLGVTASYNSTFRLSPAPWPGTYTVHVTSSYGGEQSTNSTNFTVGDTQYPPQASFTYSPPTPYVNQQVTFDASGSTAEGYGDYIVSYKWNFGDGTSPETKTVPTITHAYTSKGTRTVILNVTDNEGLWCTTSKQITILPPSPPTAIFTYSPPTPSATGVTTFNATLSKPGFNGTHNVPIVSYKWDFGDGKPKETKTTPTITHVYATNGTYTVTLNVTDAGGLWNTTSQILTVALPYGPKANFTYLPSQPFINGLVIFDASISLPGWNGTTQPIIRYKWDFGDNTSVTKIGDPIATHVYTVNKTYTVTLNVTDAQGHWNITSKMLNVSEVTIMHDIIVTNITLSATEAYPTWINPLRINVTVKNNGTTAENFTVTAYYNNTPINTKTVTNLLAGNWTTLIFNWNIPSIPKEFPYPIYTLSANASAVPGEINITNNHLSDGAVMVAWPGDVTNEFSGPRDGHVNLLDLALLAQHWFSMPHYDPRVDFNMDGAINLLDLAIMAQNWFSGPLDP